MGGICRNYKKDLGHESVTVESFLEILKDILQSFADDLPESWSFTQDEAAIYCSMIVRNWLHDEFVSAIGLPSYSL